MYDTTHPAYGKLQELGKEITSTVRPEAVVVFSAHWQAGGSRHGETQADVVEVNVGEQEGLIYEYGLYHLIPLPPSMQDLFDGLNNSRRRLSSGFLRVCLDDKTL